MSRSRRRPALHSAAPADFDPPPLSASEHASRVLAVTASAPLPLDSFLARIGAATPPRTAHTVSSHASTQVDTLTLFDTDAAAPAAAARAQPSRPLALILPVEEVTCACGCVTRCVTSYVLVRYAVNEHAFHHRRETLTDAMRRLPRERHVIARTVPYCESCFDA